MARRYRPTLNQRRRAAVRAYAEILDYGARVDARPVSAPRAER